MSTPTASAANTAAIAAYTAIVDAATAQWMADATTLINNATALGKFELTLQSSPNISMADIVSTFEGLGYTVFAPTWQFGQPAEMFGFFWDEYWQQRNICTGNASYSIRFVWGLPPIV